MTTEAQTRVETGAAMLNPERLKTKPRNCVKKSAQLL
jgi:hypothetical protein